MYRIQLIVLLVCLITGLAQADPAELFSQVEKNTKGPFGLNYLQGTRSRTTVRSGASPSDFLFQAAFRNEAAEQLALNHGFYTGNLFTTNYYNMMSATVYNGLESFRLDHQALLASGSSTMAQSTEIVKHWVLEKYYISKFPESGITRGFNTRGIAGSEFEQEFANYYFNYYLSFIKNSFQFLPVYLLAKQSPISNSSSLEKSRNMIKDAYDYFSGVWGSSDSRVRGLYKIRNAIHNNLSENVLPMIEIYLEENPWYEAQGNTYLQEIYRMLSAYFKADVGKIKDLAEMAGFTNIIQAAEMIENGGVNKSSLFRLSETLVEARKSLSGQDVPWDKKAKGLACIVSTTAFINKEVLHFSGAESNELALTLLNIIFAEGFLIEDNWSYFYEELANSETTMLASNLRDILEVASMTLDDVFSSTVTTWANVSGETTVQHFRDDTLKSSSLNSVSVILNKGN